MGQINIVYIDDSPEAELGRYLDHYEDDTNDFHYSDVIFDPSKGYESLLNDIKVQSANIIFIDSRLFENTTAVHGKFSGEEFKLVLKKMYPFIETIVITQNKIDEGLEMVPKYDTSSDVTAQEYYKSVLPELIEKACCNISQYRILAEKIQENESWENVLKEKIINTLNGIKTYDELTKQDLDEIIKAFKYIQEKIDG